MIKFDQITINMTTNIIALSLSAFINIWITPIIINKLGLSAYGYVSVINNLIGFFAVITYTLNSMVGRFYTISYKKGQSQVSNEYISTALFTSIFIALILLPIAIIATLFLDELIVIKSSLVIDVKIAFFLSCITFFLSTILAVYNTGAYCQNRLEINNGITIFGNLARLFLLILLFNLFNPKIWFLSCTAIVQNIINISLAYISFKYLIPSVKFSIKNYRILKAKELLSAGMYNSLILVGTTLISQISILVANRYLDADIVGIYSSMVLLPTLIQQIGSSISSAFSPSTLAIYSSGKINQLNAYSNKVVMICAYLLGWPISVITAMGVPIFHLWLKIDYSSHKMIFAVLMLYLVSSLAFSQLNVVNQAFNKLRLPAYFSIIVGVYNFFLSILLVTKYNMGLWGIVIANVSAFFIRNIIFVPIYTSKITNQPWYIYFKGIIKPQILSIVIYFIGVIAEGRYLINNFFTLFIMCILLSIIYWFFGFIMLGKNGRSIVCNIIKSRICKSIS